MKDTLASVNEEKMNFYCVSPQLLLFDLPSFGFSCEEKHKLKTYSFWYQNYEAKPSKRECNIEIL
jgi:GTP-binding protein EngB required for normal cell division